MSYQYILFDYDGCLADTVNCWAKAINKASVEFGLRLNEVQIRAQFGGLSKVRYAGLSEGRVPAYVDRVKALARGESPSQQGFMMAPTSFFWISARKEKRWQW